MSPVTNNNVSVLNSHVCKNYATRGQLHHPHLNRHLANGHLTVSSH